MNKICDMRIFSSILIIFLFTVSPMRASADVDADDYFTRINATSSISVSDQAAITNFVVAAKAHGYWDKLVDVGPLAGNNLAAALVKLKYPLNASTTVENRNFVEADYSPTGGLVGTSTAPYKWLNTKINYNTMTDSVGGMAFWLGSPSAGTTKQRLLMGLDNVATPFVNMSSAGTLYLGGTVNAGMTMRTGADGFYHGRRQSPTMLKYFLNGTSISTSTAAAGTTTRSSEITVFAGNRTISASGSTVTGSLDGTGFFYSIDNGLMSDVEAASYAADVEQLQISLGRIVPKAAPMKFAFIIGQSLASGSGGAPALSTSTQLYSNKMFIGATTMPTIPNQMALGPLVEASLETLGSAFTNLVSSSTRATSPGDSSQDLMIANWGLGSAGYATLKKGTTQYNNSMTSLVNAKRLSPRYNQGFVVPGIVVVHGEADTGSFEYQNDIEQWQADYENDIKAITGQSSTIPMFHTQASSFGVFTRSGYAMIAASEANPTKHILVGPKYFLQHSDGVHLVNTSYRKLGEYYAKAWNKVVVQGGTWTPLSPESVTLTGRDIDIQFKGNVGSLVLDTTLVSDPGNYGFVYSDSATSTTISSVTVTGSSTVRITLADVPTGDNKKIAYAVGTGVSGAGGPTTGPRGNLRDSDPALSQYDSDNNGFSDNLYNWTVHFEKYLPVEPEPVTSEAPKQYISAGSSGGYAAVPQSLGGPLQTAVPVVTTPISTSVSFTKNLSSGMVGIDIKRLQEYLNLKGFTVSTKGAGSAGKETTFFGSATRAALARFQKANGISPAVGFFGPITRAFIANMK